ncbi:MAG: hypothetical protein P1U80_07585 [Pseudomonadales bacterium]|nr:hypothetical protein [Pseudomonadales bacterium]
MKKASLTNRVKKTIANKKIARQTIIALSLILLGSAPVRADQNTDILALQQGWAETNYQLRDKAQLSAFEKLIDEATLLTEQNPQSAPAWIWSGIIKSTYAGARGGLGALKFAKAAKADLEQAMKLDPKAMNGSAYASLGVLYFNVPGWPIGFGDDDKAEELLLKALAINPDGIDSNYFYGDFLLNEKRYQDAEKYLLKAQNAPKRPDRPLADAGRQKEIALALSKVQIKLK